MKNLLIYINPRHDFDDEHKRYVQIQVDNSLLYWKPEDITIATNFPYEYHGIKSLVLPDSLFCEFEPRNSKGNGIVYLLDNKILTETTWVHDFEAFQTAPFNLKLNNDLGLTDYGWRPNWNTGSIFFKPEALDIFYELRDGVYKKRAPDEPILWNLYRSDFKNIQSRCQKLNITYNLGMRYHDKIVPMAEKPIRVMHFHPYRHGKLYKRFKPLLPEYLYKLFLKYD